MSTATRPRKREATLRARPATRRIFLSYRERCGDRIDDLLDDIVGIHSLRPELGSGENSVTEDVGSDLLDVVWAN
jgi:hypothetical protein